MYLPDLIFKNQAMSSRDKDKGSGHFVNDLLRTEFHKYVTVTHRLSSLLNLSYRKFMAKFIKVSFCLGFIEIKLMPSCRLVISLSFWLYLPVDICCNITIVIPRAAASLASRILSHSHTTILRYSRPPRVARTLQLKTMQPNAGVTMSLLYALRDSIVIATHVRTRITFNLCPVVPCRSHTAGASPSLPSSPGIL